MKNRKIRSNRTYGTSYMNLSRKKSSLKMPSPKGSGRVGLSKSLIPEKDSASRTSSNQDLTSRPNKSATISSNANRGPRKKFSYLQFAEKKEQAKQEGKAPKKGSLYLDILKKKKHKTYKKQRTSKLKKEKTESNFYYEDDGGNVVEKENPMAKSSVEVGRAEVEEKERMSRTEVIKIEKPEKIEKEQEIEVPKKESPPRNKMGESGNIIEKLKSEIQKNSQRNLLEMGENEMIIQEALNFSKIERGLPLNKLEKKRKESKKGKKSKRKDHLNSQKISAQIEAALRQDPQPVFKLRSSENQQEINPVVEGDFANKVESNVTKLQPSPVEKTDLKQNPSNSKFYQENQEILKKRNLQNERTPIQKKKVEERAEKTPHDLMIRPLVSAQVSKREFSPNRQISQTKGRMTLRQIRQAYKSKKEKRDKSHNKIELIKETINASRVKEEEKIPDLTQSEIKVDTQGNYIVPKKIFEKISQTQQRLMQSMPPLPPRPDFQPTQLQSINRKKEIENEQSIMFSEMSRDLNDSKQIDSPRDAKLPQVSRNLFQEGKDPENPFDNPQPPPSSKMNHQINITRNFDFHKKERPGRFVKSPKKERESRRPPEMGEATEGMFGSQPIVMNNNFVNYNYYINDIRQSNFGSQTQKIPPKRKNTNRGEGMKKKGVRVKSEMNTSKIKKNLNKMTDKEKLKYFEKYKKKFGVDYKGDMQKRKASKGSIKAGIPSIQVMAEVKKVKGFSQRVTGKVESGQTGMRVKSYRKPVNRQKKSRENFIKRNMKLIKQAKLKNENKLPKAMKTGELQRNISKARKDEIIREHKKSKSQVISRKTERTRLRTHGKRGVNGESKRKKEPKAIEKGRLDMEVIKSRMEKERKRGIQKVEETKKSENRSKNESFLSKGTQNRTFLSRSPMTKKPSMDQKLAYKTMQNPAEKKGSNQNSKKRKYILSSMKEKRKIENARKKKEEEDRKKEIVKKEKNNRKEVTRIGSHWMKAKKKEPKKEKAKVAANESSILDPESSAVDDSFLDQSLSKAKKKKAVLFSELRGLSVISINL